MTSRSQVFLKNEIVGIVFWDMYKKIIMYYLLTYKSKVIIELWYIFYFSNIIIQVKSMNVYLMATRLWHSQIDVKPDFEFYIFVEKCLDK